MPTTIDILALIEEQKTSDIKQLSKKLEIPPETLTQILLNLAKYQLIECNEKTGKINLPLWLTKIDGVIEKTKPPTGTIILPRFQEVKIQDIAVGNFTKNDLELNIRLKARLKEIVICDCDAS
jgi:hypothetical protein